MITRSQKAKSPEAAGLFTNETKIHERNSTADDGGLLDVFRAELGRFGLAVRKCQPGGYFATCKQSTHFLRDFADMTALCAKIARGASNTLIESAVLAPTASGASSRPDFGGHGATHIRRVFGRGASVRKAGGMADSMLLTPRPPVARSKAASGFQSQSGAQTMPTIVIKKRTSIAPIATTSTELTAQARQRLQEAVELLQCTPSEEDTARALGRVLTAARALKRVVGGAA